MNKVSVIIIAKNEESRISEALESVRWADEIIVVDSKSIDKTCEIAANFTDKIFVREFDDFSSQKNFAVSKCSNRWVLSIDCDEIVTDSLRDAIIATLNSRVGYDAYRFKRVNRLFNKVLLHAAGNDFPIRLFNKDKARFIQPIHEFLKVDGETGLIEAELLHNTTEDIASEYRKTDSYTEFEAKWLLEKNTRPYVFKLILYPVLVFLNIYILKRGFLDGLNGLIYAYVSARYCFVKYLKARKLIKDRSYLENKIAGRFDEIYFQFPDSIDDKDLRLRALIDNLGPLKGALALEIGCGKGRFTNAAKKQGAGCIGIDVSFNLVNEGIKKNNGTLLLSSATEICFKEDTFDLVFLVEVIEHIPDLDSLIREARRVLKPNGRLVIIDRNIFSINNRRLFVPNAIIKKYHEIKNDWMYPKGFPYTERWFSAGKIAKRLRRYFNTAEACYVISDSEAASKTAFLFKSVPITRHFILWKATGSSVSDRICRAGTTIKEFGPIGMRVRERVAKAHAAVTRAQSAPVLSDIFCLRIDADEYGKDSFSRYYSVFEKYKRAITIFFNANSFIGARDAIMRCKEMELDIQSHGFYHHTYNDYKSNRYNISKAKAFFQEQGIVTKGFVAPMGKWNWQLMRALEDEGYEYSSDFSYDYLGFPHYPRYKNNVSRVLEIPIFPVCPELFFQHGGYGFNDILNYYKSAISEMIYCRIPVIIYAHTSLEYSDVVKLLEKILEYVTSEKGLRNMSMTEINDYYRKEVKTGESNDIIKPKIPKVDYMGREVDASIYSRVKYFVKDRLDFEKVTPAAELQCGAAKRALKRLTRKIV